MRALDRSNSLGEELEPWNTGATIAETDCWISVPNPDASSENGASIIALDFSNLPIKKIERLSTVGDRVPAAPGDWLTTKARLVFALRNGAKLESCHAVIDTGDPFVFHIEVTPSLTSEAMIAAAEYLDQFGLNCGIMPT